ncbi:MAG TPA: T9SS type A sorting domain-containing protein [Bacteroidia bacterium]|nr:T9SS type A sorting domain-containing protein [Bacteroidia bacterium]
MVRKLILLLIIFSARTAVAQFAPPAGYPGTTAMYKDSTAFVAWATGCKIIRGYKDISDPSGGYVTLGDSLAAIGKADGIKVVSLGDGGTAIVTFEQPIKNGPGNDFAVFENSFSDTFLELAFVEVSSDGINYIRFPATSNTQDTVQLDNAAEMDARRINNLAGKYRGSYGTPFDLEELANAPGLNINSVTHVKITDVVGSILPAYTSYDKNGKKINDPWPTAFASGGFDLDAVGVIHQGSSTHVSELNETLQFDVFPNPITASSFIQLYLRETGSVLVEILDLTGKQVAVVANELKIQTVNKIQLGELNLKNGIYLLSITNGQVVTTKKILVCNE